MHSKQTNKQSDRSPERWNSIGWLTERSAFSFARPVVADPKICRPHEIRHVNSREDDDDDDDDDSHCQWRRRLCVPAVAIVFSLLFKLRSSLIYVYTYPLLGWARNDEQNRSSRAELLLLGRPLNEWKADLADAI